MEFTLGVSITIFRASLQSNKFYGVLLHTTNHPVD